MSMIKSFSVGNGDFYYIRHNSKNFSIIDCCMDKDNIDGLLYELKSESDKKEITRFISTHPDIDHILGLKRLDDYLEILNFYCVKNEATKPDETEDFIRYCELRDSDKAFFLYKGCSRYWMNKTNEKRGSAGIDILWPITDNEDYQNELEKAKDGISFNNISPIIEYSIQDGVKFLWFGDLETEFMKKIVGIINLPKADIIFAPHHGRRSGKLPKIWLDQIEPKIIVIGEAPSANIDYYQGYNKITQNSAKSIIFDCDYKNKVHIYTSNYNYSVTYLDTENVISIRDHHYLGTLNL